MLNIRQWGWEYAANDQRGFITKGVLDPLKKSIKLLCPDGHRGRNKRKPKKEGEKNDKKKQKNKKGGRCLRMKQVLNKDIFKDS